VRPARIDPFGQGIEGKNTQSAVNFLVAELKGSLGGADFGMIARPLAVAAWGTPK